MKLRAQVILSYLPVLIIPILVVGLITRSAAEYGLTVLVTNEATRRTNSLVGRFVNYYNQNNHSWTGVEAVFNDPFVRNGGPANQQNPPMGQNRNGNPNNPNNPPPATALPPGFQPPLGAPLPANPSPDLIILVDPKGAVIAANSSEMTGQTLTLETVAKGLPIYSDNKIVGVLVIGASLGAVDPSQQALLDGVNRALIVSALLSAMVALLLGLWFSGRLVAPLAALMNGVRGLAADRWSPVPVRGGRGELSELTHAFNQMADDLTRQQNLRKQMIADIAHDLRTPLSVMTLEIEGIKAGLQTPEESAQSLQEEVIWLSRLVDDLHTLSLIDAGQFPIQMEPTDLTLFLESVYKQWRTVAEQENRRIALEMPPGLPIVNIDPPRMRQVLGNLIGNAIQHTPPDASIILRVEKEMPQGEHVQIRVIDNGQGIPPEALAHLFERFYRVDKSRKRNRKSASGSGLGLSIAHQLTALQGGLLSVESALGRGTTFTVEL
jgi:signal transduction histidine kinase